MRRKLGGVLGAVVVVLATGGTASAAVSCTTAGATRTCAYTPAGAEQMFTVPAGVTTVHVDAVGAAGGVGLGEATPGRGSRVSGELAVTPGSVLYVEVGGAPTRVDGVCYPAAACVGGWNGGGTSVFGGGGGGASDVRTISIGADPSPGSATSLGSRRIVAAGGGGTGEQGFCTPEQAPAPGGDAGQPGATAPSCGPIAGGTGGGAGTSSSGGAGGTPRGLPGALGIGGNGGVDTGGGGGAGHFGGGGGGNLVFGSDDNTGAGGGGGGSNLVPAGGSSTLTTNAASVSISFPNTTPAVQDDTYATDEDTMLTVSAPGPLGNDDDADGDPLTAALVSGPTHAADFTLNPDGSFDYTPDADYNGPDSFSYKADDGSLQSVAATVSITVNAVNDVPTCTAVGATTDEDTALDVAPDCADVDNQALTFAIADQPEHGTASVVTGELHYTPDTDYNGPDSFTYEGDDGNLQSAAATVSITVAAVDDAPTCSGMTVVTDEDTALDVAPDCADVEDEPLSFAIADQPEHGTASVVAGELHYTPDADYNGPDSFTYKADEVSLQSTAATVSITVDAVNDAPTCTGVTAATDEDTALDVAPDCADVENEPLSFAITEQPAHGSASVVAGKLRYTPAAGYSGPDAFSYRANDGTRDSGPAAVTISVAARPAVPASAPPATAPAAPAAPSTAPPRSALRLTVARLSTFGAAGSPVRCRMTTGTLTACSVKLLSGRRVLARGRAKARGDRARKVTVEIRLTKHGRTLLTQRLGGKLTRVAATATTSDGTRSARTRTRAILAVERFTTPAGSWLPNQAAISPAGRRFLRTLRGKLIAITSLRCDGYTAKVTEEAPNAMRISARRAAIACAVLERLGVDAAAKVVGHGDSHPVASNDTSAGRAKNRRVEVTIRHARTRL